MRLAERIHRIKPSATLAVTSEVARLRATGVEVIDFPASERAKLAANASKHWQEWAADKEKRGLPGKALLEFVQAKIKEHAK